MTTVTYSGLGTSADLLGTDLIATWRSAGPLKTITGAVAKAYFGADYLPLAGGTMTGAIVAYAGTESLPGLSFASDTDTGIYRIAANNVGISVGGVKVADFASGASSIVGTLTATAFSGPLTGNVTGAVTGNATTATALATGRTISITGDMTYTSGSFDGSGNVTGTGTLATVNGNVGSFTNASITVNAKGLITAASSGTQGAGLATANTFTDLNDFTAGANVTPATTPAANAIGYLGSPQNTKTSNYTLVMSDAGKTIVGAAGAGGGDTWTIPASASVAYPTGTRLYFLHMGTASNTIAITTQSLTWLPTKGTGSRTIASGGQATAQKMADGNWVIWGVGLT